MNRIKIIGIALSLIMLFSTNCFANTQKLKIHEENKTILIEDKVEYKNSIENEITLDGSVYKLKEVKEQENKNILTKEKEETEEKVVNTTDKYNVLILFEKEKQIEENEYIGTLELQENSLELVANESYIEEYKVELRKEYKNVPQNELNDIPKVIQENGITYYLVNPVWQIAETQNIDGQQIPTSYNGIMNYEGIKPKRVVKNYIAKVTYKGTLKKEEAESITFNLIYEEIEKQEKNNTPAIITTSAGIIFLSGLIILKRKNVYIYLNNKGRWKLTKEIKISKNDRLINITPTVPITGRYRVVLSNGLYKSLLNENVTIKYCDKQYIYKIEEKKFDICV